LTKLLGPGARGSVLVPITNGLSVLPETLECTDDREPKEHRDGRPHYDPKSSSGKKRYAWSARGSGRSGIVSTWIAQILNLLNLSPAIQEQILFLPRTERGRDLIHLAQLLPIALAKDWKEQDRLWRRLVAATQTTNRPRPRGSRATAGIQAPAENGRTG
jgi:hypothetical protein